MAASRAIVGTITAGLRAADVPVIWVLHANTRRNGRSDWELFFNHFVADEVRDRTIDCLAPGSQTVWRELKVGNSDMTIIKNRYSALVPERPRSSGCCAISASIPR